MNTTISAAIAAVLAIAPVTLRAQTMANVWSNPSAALPVQSTILNGPWTLSNPLISSPPAQTDYCLNGVINTSANPAPDTMNPFYFPFIIGEGQKIFGLFDYRPSSVNEITVAAKSNDAGKTWTWLQQALNVSGICPTSNTPSNSDTGLGHPYMLSFAGAKFLYLLDRRGGHVDVDGLTVHRILPTVALPLHAKPPLNGTIVSTGPANNTGIIAGWDFANYPVTSKTSVNAPAADLGPMAATAKASGFGMTNTYWCSATPNGTAPAYGSVNFDDVAANSGNSVASANEWRIRGAGLTTGPQCNGWDLDAPQYSQGAQFSADTTGVANVLLEYDWYSTAQGFHNLQVQYSLNVNATNPVWTNIGPTQIAIPKGYNNQLTVDFTNVPGAGNNPNFGIRFAGAYDPTIPAGSYTDGDYSSPPDGKTTTVNFAAGQAYTGATTAANGAPAIYNDNSGNWRFSNVKFFDATKFSKTSGGTPTDYATETTGLLNPDGILATIPNTYPRKVLYVQKQLSAASPANACAAPGPGGKINYDVDTIRLAQTTDGVHFTDLGATNILNPAATDNLSLRYAAPNGSIVKFANGTFGLFFGAGNCEDGDSDGFHAIAYAENTDGTYLNWNVVNGMNNPIAEIAYSTATPATAPLTGVSSETNGQQNYWFGGRVYNPNAIYLDANHVSLIFAGYNYGYFGSDLSSYRTIGQITLTSSNPLIP
jgi:hypothetical protein